MSTADHRPYDVIIVGGGPAGLSAALVLGRCRRRVLVCDAGRPRNARSQGLHGYLTRDGIRPFDFLRLAQDELDAYDVQRRGGTVTRVVAHENDGFEVMLDSGDRVRALTILLATGVRDNVPDIPGLLDCYGISVHHCPYCDGWEERDKTVGVIAAEGISPAGLALSLQTWSRDIIVFANGRTLGRVHRRKLRDQHIAVHDAPIARVESREGRLTHVALNTGIHVPCEAIFFTAPQAQQCDLARDIGCEFTPGGTVKTDALGTTCVPGVYVVGDASRDVQFVIVAAAEGAKAGVAINKALQSRTGVTA